MVIRGDDAKKLHLQEISDIVPVAPKWRAGVGYEFLERPDGFRGWSDRYNLHFAESPKVMDLGLIYRALVDHQVDIVAGNSTDGLIDSLGLVALADDRHYFPPYDAVPSSANPHSRVFPNSARRWPISPANSPPPTSPASTTPSTPAPGRPRRRPRLRQSRVCSDDCTSQALAALRPALQNALIRVSVT